MGYASSHRHLGLVRAFVQLEREQTLFYVLAAPVHVPQRVCHLAPDRPVRVRLHE